MLVMRTVEDRADSFGQLVSREQPLRLYDLALAMRTHLGSTELSHGLFLGKRQLMILTPASPPAVFDFSVVRGDPASELFGDVLACVVPDQNPNPLACRLELLAAPRK